MYHYVSCGLPNVFLKNGYAEKVTPFGKAVSIIDVEGLHAQIALTIANSERQLTGAEFRFMRKYLDMSQPALGAVIGVSDQTIANYEKGEPTETADKFLRLLVIEHVKGSVQILEMINQINDLDRANQEEQKLVFESAQLESNDIEWREITCEV